MMPYDPGSEQVQSGLHLIFLYCVSKLGHEVFFPRRRNNFSGGKYCFLLKCVVTYVNEQDFCKKENKR